MHKLETHLLGREGVALQKTGRIDADADADAVADAVSVAVAVAAVCILVAFALRVCSGRLGGQHWRGACAHMRGMRGWVRLFAHGLSSVIGQFPSFDVRLIS